MDCGRRVGRATRPRVSSTIGHRLELTGETATAALAGRLATVARPGDVIALGGDLGSGKTTLARGFIRALGVAEEVPSPTFTLVQTYETPRGMVWHFDLYRLAQPEDSFELGLEEAFAEGIVLIEWPERLGALLPRERLDVALTMAASPEGRIAELRASPEWEARLRGILGK
jgi:tRNA threonylcarbamoyladenosine biosynthesis protein TsaE